MLQDRAKASARHCFCISPNRLAGKDAGNVSAVAQTDDVSNSGSVKVNVVEQVASKARGLRP
jgi:hypothetical protein